MHSAHSRDSGFVRMQPEGKHSSQYPLLTTKPSVGRARRAQPALSHPLSSTAAAAQHHGQGTPPRMGGRARGPGTPEALQSPRAAIPRGPGAELGAFL